MLLNAPLLHTRQRSAFRTLTSRVLAAPHRAPHRCGRVPRVGTSGCERVGVTSEIGPGLALSVRWFRQRGPRPPGGQDSNSSEGPRLYPQPASSHHHITMQSLTRTNPRCSLRAARAARAHRLTKWHRFRTDLIYLHYYSRLRWLRLILDPSRGKEGDTNTTGGSLRAFQGCQCSRPGRP